LKEKAMAQIPGRLVADLHPNGTTRMVFIATVSGGNETPFTAKDFDAAETIFMTSGLTQERAAGLRAELDWDEVVSAFLDLLMRSYRQQTGLELPNRI
jgi:hypothetical protein